MLRRPFLGSIAGLLAAAVALGVGELVSGAIGGASLVVAVGDVVVDYSPGAVTRATIEALGNRDKPALLVGVVVSSLAIGAFVGAVATRNRTAGVAGLVVFGLVGALAGARDSQTTAAQAGLTAFAAAGSGVLALWWLLGAASPLAAADDSTEGEPGLTGRSRRRFMRVVAGAGGVALLSTFAGRRLFGPAVDVEAARRAVVLPPPAAARPTPVSEPLKETDQPSSVPRTATPASAPPPERAIDVEGLSALVTPNDEFYRVDTALSVPGVDVESWRLRITGMVDRPYELTFLELIEMSLREEPVTLACVSNQVGGRLIGNAIWQGVPLADLLDRAGVKASASQVVARSVDGFTVGFPTEVALDGRASMVAVGMNGQPLPAEHGFPARMIVPGLYGYVSATKWLEEIELTTLEGFDAYWIPRGWAKQAPIKTQSRIDVPRAGRTVAPGLASIAGVAWGGIRGVSAVQVRVTDRNDPASEGEWIEARLGAALSRSTWRRWVAGWEATAGNYRIEVRATDGEGQTQTEVRRAPAPDGATGYHRVHVTVGEP